MVIKSAVHLRMSCHVERSAWLHTLVNWEEEEKEVEEEECVQQSDGVEQRSSECKIRVDIMLSASNNVFVEGGD